MLTLLPEKIPLVNQPITHLSKHKVKSIIAVPPGHQQLSTVEDAQEPAQQAIARFSFSEIYTDYYAETPVSTNPQGFFYYHRPPDRPEISGQIRFRLCSDPASFDQGPDLIDDTGTPWNISLVDILRSRHEAFYSTLLRDGILTKSLIDDIRRLQHLGPGRTRDMCLFSISDPFALDLSLRLLRMHFVTRKSDNLFLFRRPWIDRRRHMSTKEGKRVEETLYTGACRHGPLRRVSVSKISSDRSFEWAGAIKARFELSTHPEHDKLGPTLVLRTLDIIEPARCLIPDYDGFVPPPVVGQLHGRMMGDVFVPWAMPLLRKKACKNILTFLRHSSDQGGRVAPTAENPTQPQL